MRILFFSALLVSTFFAQGQEMYVAPTDSLVIQKLQQWQDLKFGLLMHWGPYSQWGVVESWSICPEDEGWTRRTGQLAGNYFEYKKAYEKLQTSFNPYYFKPENWAAAAKAAGMRYVVFTTKHHDGFCMFDTKETDYRITSQKTPFSYSPRRNVAKEIFDAFRSENFMTGAYFSKADWHNENYWWSYFPPKDRNVNYDPKKYPERWQAFKDFTFNQIRELMSQYGKMDILWLDAGWVRGLTKADSLVPGRAYPYDQDIDMHGIAQMARSYQPGLIVVDRAVGGEFENYRTPEQQVPATPLPWPWETCMTMGNSWSYVPGDVYKPASELIGLLVKVVSRGGNFLLNIGPGPEGDWDPVAYQRLKQIGAWMRVNGEAIYSSRPLEPFSSGPCSFTRSRDGRTRYAFYTIGDSTFQLPPVLSIDSFSVPAGSRVSLLGSQEKISWKQEGNKVILMIPVKIRQQVVLMRPPVITFRFAS